MVLLQGTRIWCLHADVANGSRMYAQALLLCGSVLSQRFNAIMVCPTQFVTHAHHLAICLCVHAGYGARGGGGYGAPPPRSGYDSYAGGGGGESLGMAAFSA